MSRALGLAGALVLSIGCAGGCGSASEPDVRRPGAAKDARSAPARYFPASFFTRRIPGSAAIDPESERMVRELRNMAFGVDPATEFNCRHAVLSQPAQWTAEEQLNCRQVTTRAGITFDAFAPVLYTVPADQPRVPVAIDNPNLDLRRIMAQGVPIPDGAEPAIGSDAQLIIWQPKTDTMWEFWRARREQGSWHAGYGGRIRNVSESPGHFRDVADPGHPGRFIEHHSWGGPASSIPNLPGLITVEQLRSGKIGHALVFATWSNDPDGWVYPAQRTDGICRGVAGQYCSEIPQGARFRLDPGYDTSQIEHPIVRMIAEAVQDYGMVLNNSTGGGVSFYAEGWRAHGRRDPYHGRGGLFTAAEDQPQPTLFMREFPWERLQLLRRGPTCTDRTTECEPPRQSP